MPNRIYLDHNATTPVHSEVRKSMAEALENLSGNPSSVHHEGQQARLRLEHARKAVATLLAAKSEEIFFTSGGTESNNLALFSFLDRQGEGAKPHEVITTPVEHPSILNPLRHLEKFTKIKLKFLPVDGRGQVDLGQFENLLSEETRLVTIMLVNNELGTRYPIEEIIRICQKRSRPVPVHCDAIQAVGRLEIRPRDIGLASLSLSAHKFYGPKGIGALWVNQELAPESLGPPLQWLNPRQFGGGQEAGKRSGTENLPGIVGLGRACELAAASQKEWFKKLLPLRDLLEKTLLETIDGVSINGEGSERIYSTTNLSFAGVSGDVLQQTLDLSGIAVATGSACSSGTVSGSHVLLALGQKPEKAREAVRISLGIDNTEEDMIRTAAVIAQAVKRIRDAFAPRPSRTTN